MTTPIPIIESTDAGLVVTSETIAAGADVQHKNVLGLIETHGAALSRFGRVAFETRPFATPGGTQEKRIALLNEQQSTLVLTLMRNSEKVVAFKVALVAAFFEMAQQLAKPRELSRTELAQMVIAAEAERKALEAKVEQDAPAVAYVESFVADNDLLLFRTVASDLGVGEGELRWALAHSSWIYRESYRRKNSKNQIVTDYRWSEYASKKPYFFRVVSHEAPRFRGEAMFTLKITPQGAAAIARLVARITDEHGSLRAALPHLEAAHRQRLAKQEALA